MTPKELSEITSPSYPTLMRWLKKAREAGDKYVVVDDEVYYFAFVEGMGGKGEVYNLTAESDIIKPRKTKSTTINFAHLAELDGFNILSTKHTKEEKLLLVTFMCRYNYTLKIIIETLLLGCGEGVETKRVEALRRKFMRWHKDYKAHGAKALADKRGKNRAKFSKIDEALLKQAILGAGARGVRENYYGVHDFYCYLWQRKYAETFTRENEKIISYSALVSGIKKVFKSDVLVKAFWDKGHDGLLQAYPVGIKDITYANQEWQVDATKFDFMVKLTLDDGIVKIARHNLTAVIDVHTGNAVATLTQKIDTYAQVRVLHKAFTRMGLPELVYMDNGRDYVSQHYSDVLDDMNIDHINAEVGQGRQKGKIERFFGVVQTELAKLPGYIGNNVAKRTHIEDQTASKIDVRTSKATRIKENRLLTFEEMDTIVNNILARASENYKAQEEQLMQADVLEDVRRKLGKKHRRPLHRDGVKVNGFTYISSALWTQGLATGNKVDVYEDIDDINTVYVYSEEKFVCIGRNRKLGVDAMSLEEFKAAKKADKKNNINPVRAMVRDAQELYEAYEDDNAAELLEITPEYAKPKPKTKESKPAANTDFRDAILEQLA